MNTRRAAAILALAAIALVSAAFTSTSEQQGWAASFPSRWTVYAGNPEHNAAFEAGNAPPPIRRGVSWSFAEANALPLNAGPQDEDALGFLAAAVKTTQEIGNAVGVTAVDGKIFAESDWFKVYALNALTGTKIWEADTLNENMGNPVVAGGRVFVGSGDTGFSFANTMKYAHGQPATRGMGFASVSAFDENTGRQLWRYATRGEDMPSVVYLNGKVYFGNGDGHVYALDAATGRPAWITSVGGFDSMSSANLWHDPATGRDLILAGFTDPNFLFALDASSGAVVWKATIPGVFNTGMGDNSPTVDSARGLVFQDSVVNFDPIHRTSGLAIFAVDANSGAVRWITQLGIGPSPLAYKAAISMVHAGVVYVGNPANGQLTALDETNGHVIWQTDLGYSTWKGTPYKIQNRGGPIIYRGVLYQAAGPYVFALDSRDGRILATYQPGGRFGIVNPVIVGGTMYLGNSWGWVIAIPLSNIYPGAQDSGD
jgi:outer membrane protein assembly factor BamB